uniref:Uncharacterized protein n=1 Tax=Nelumbo nucifera TaxID=4432 RepID=A0A822ZJ04_NELNU|nr:TPA_asm: hypothetical protein HUJ06_004304 [Nelumbo nucifera]
MQGMKSTKKGERGGMGEMKRYRVCRGGKMNLVVAIGIQRIDLQCDAVDIWCGGDVVEHVGQKSSS